MYFCDCGHVRLDGATGMSLGDLLLVVADLYDLLMRASENSPASGEIVIPPQTQRRHRRFNLQFPVSLSYPCHGALRELNAVSANISIGGVLLKAADAVPAHTQVRLVMDVRGPWSHRPVRLVAKGEVVRVEDLGVGGGFSIAVRCLQPITEMKGRLAVAS